MQHEDSDLGDLKIDLGAPGAQGYGGMAEQTVPRYDQHDVEAAREEPKPKATGFFSCFSVEFYQPYFDIVTDDVKQRILATLNPRKNDFFDVIKDRPDLYGPLWIYTTVTFVLAVAGNFASFADSFSKGEKLKSHFNFVPIAGGIIFGIGLGLPLVFSFALRYLGSKVRYLDALCIYGYGTFVLIPALIIAMIPIGLLQWLVLIAAVANMTWFLLNNYAHELQKYEGKQKYVLLGLIGVAQLSLLLVFKLLFLEYSFIY